MIRLLHLEDDRDDFTLLQLGLKKLRDDIEITWSESVAEALETLAENEFDCIISDFQLPKRDGLEMLMEVRQRGIDIPFIFLTGQGNEELAAKVFREGANDYYTKIRGFAHYERILNSITRNVEAYRNRRAHKKTEEALQLTQFTLDVTAIPVLRVRKNGSIDYANRAACESLGYTESEMLSMQISQIDPIIGGPNWGEAWESLCREGALVTESQNIRKDGTSFPVEITVNYLEHGGQELSCAFVQDISERKRSEAAIREERDKARQYIDIAGVILQVIGRDYKIKMINRKGCEVLGLTEEEILGRDAFGAHLVEEKREYWRELFDSVMAGEAIPMEYVESVVRDSSGNERLIAWHNSVLHDEQGNIIGTLSSGEDITEQRKIENELKESVRIHKIFFGCAYDGLMALDIDGNILECSSRAADMFGYDSPDRIAGKILPDLSPEYQEDGVSSKEKWSRYQGNVLSEPQQLFRWTIQKQSGELSNLEVTLSKLGFEDTNLVLATLRDTSHREYSERDTIERRKVEEALKETEEKYRRLFESAFDGIFLLNDEGEILDCNQRVAEILGYDSREQIIGHSHYEFSTAYQRGSMFSNEAARKYKEIVSTGEPQIFEWTAVRRDGDMVDLEVTLSKLDLPGRAIFVSVCRDVSQRKRAEREMLEAYKLVVEGPVVFFRTSTKEGFPIEYASPNISQFGYDHKDVATGELTIAKLIHPEDVPMIQDLVENQIERDTDHFQTELRLIDKKGKVNWVYEYAVPVKDLEGNITNFLGYAVDITQRKLIEGIVMIQRDISVALSTSESMEKALEIILDAGCRIPVFDCGGIYLVDPGTGSISLRTMRNLPQEFLDAVSFFDGESVVTKIVKEGKPVFYSIERDDHPIVELMRIAGLKSATIIPIRHGGEVVASLNLGSYKWDEVPAVAIQALETMGAIIGDEISRIQTQEQLKKSISELQRRTRDLELLNKELESFSYAVSHDLRSPLRHISGYSEMLSNRLTGAEDEEVIRYLENLATSAQKMSSMIEALFRLSSTVKGGLKLEVGNLSAIASEIAEELQALSSGRNVAFEIQEGIERHCDVRLARVVLDNLLRNAWKFSVGEENARVEFGEIEIEGRKRLFVRDNGIGFDDKNIDRLFIPFGRLHGDDEIEGTGLGLATVQRIIHRHGGRIWAESQPGEGATFYFDFGI